MASFSTVKFLVNLFQHFELFNRFIDESEREEGEPVIEELYETYRRELLLFGCSMTGSMERAEELLQETFLRALQHEHTLSGLGAAQQRAWLYRTAKNVFLDQKRRSRYEAADEEELQERGQEPEELRLIEWKELLGSLPEDEGLFFAMRYLDGYRSGEIAQVCSVPAGTVRWKLSLARKHIRDALKKGKETAYV